MLSELIPATVVEGHDKGRFWTIDTHDVRDRGFVYSSAFASDETVGKILAEEVDAGVDQEEFDYYPFESGYLADPWVNNHLTIGIAAGFVEPLQSTARARISSSRSFSLTC